MPSADLSSSDGIDLGTAVNFVILSKTGITNVPDSVITGNIGVSPIAASSMTGFGLIMDSSNEFSRSTEVTGNVYASDYAAPTGDKLTVAVYDMEVAYNDAAGRPTTGPDYINIGAGEIGGLILGPGVYTFDILVHISAGDLTFNGTSEDLFIIQTSKSVMQAGDINVVLTGGAISENIFWVTAEEYNIAADSHTEGIILAKTAVNFITGSSINGRIFSQTAVNLQKVSVNIQTTCE
jgi:hypothetical protein